MITVVYGPPAAGKSTWVKTHAAPGDVIIDYDALAMALGSDDPHAAPPDIQQVAFAVRTTAIAKVLEMEDVTAWIIRTFLTAEEVERLGPRGVRFLLIDPGEEETLRRAQEDGRPQATLDLIDEWYAYPPTVPQPWMYEPKGSNLMRMKTATATLKADLPDLHEGEFIAYASTFVREPDAYGDIVAPGAFKNTLAEWKESGNVIPILFGHRMDDPDYNIGGVISAEEDEHGLKIHGRLDLDTPKGAQTYRLIKGRRLSQLSFAYDVVEGREIKTEDFGYAYELLEVKIYEVSLVPIGANQTTEILAVKDAVDVVAQSVKSGRALSAKNAGLLREVLQSIDSVSESLKSVLAANEDEAGAASGTPEKASPSAEEALALRIGLTLAGVHPA